MLIKSKDQQSGQVLRLTPEAARADLYHTDAALRRAAVNALFEAQDALDYLVPRLHVETDPAVREALVAALIRIGTLEVIDLFIAQLRGDEANRRNEAVHALQQMPRYSADRVCSLLADQDADMRIMAVDVIRLLTISDATIWLQELLETETNPNVVGVAVDRLTEIGEISAVPVLEMIKRRFADDAYLQFSVDHALSRIKALHAEGKT